MGVYSIPPELLTDILKYLTRADLRRASSVCRKFQDAADHVGMYIHRSVNFDDSDYLQQLTAFESLAEHAGASKPRRPTLSLAFSCVFPRARRHVEETMQRMLSAITMALPVLGRLHALVPKEFSSALYGALCFPAPRLRILALGQTNLKGSSNGAVYHPFHMFGSPRSTVVALPADLFQNSAPRLREIVLQLPTLDADWVPVAAFGRVVRVNLNLYEPGPRLVLAPFFPNVRALSVSVEQRSETSALQTTLVDLRGLNLRFLAISECLRHFVRSDVALRELHGVEQTGPSVFDETLWPEDDAARGGDLHARLVQNIQTLTLSVSPPRGRWTRAVCSSAHVPPDLLPLLLNMPLWPLAPRLVSLVIPNVFLDNFLLCPVALTALKHLLIDCTPSARQCVIPCEAYGIVAIEAAVRCPALKTISLVSVGPETPLDVQVHAVVTLGRHLGLHERAENDRAVLQLVGLRFAKPTPRERLQALFSDVREGFYMEGEVERQFYRCVAEPSAFDLSNVFSTDRRLQGI